MDHSPLGRLSAELRNMIYNYVSIGHVAKLDKFKTDGALVQTCSEIRREARLLFFATADITLSPRILRHIWARGWNKEGDVEKDRLTRELGIDLGNAFGIDALAAISKESVFATYPRAPDPVWSQLEFRFTCQDCNPLVSQGGKIEANKQDAATPDQIKGIEGIVSGNGGGSTDGMDCKWEHSVLCFKDCSRKRS